MLRRFVTMALCGGALAAPVIIGSWPGPVEAEPQPGQSIQINNLSDAFRFFEGPDGMGEVRDGTRRIEVLKRGGDATVRKVDQHDVNVREARFQVFAALADKSQIDKIRSKKEFEEFLADKEKRVVAICFQRDAVAALAEKDKDQVHLARVGDKPKSMPTDQALKGYGELCFMGCRTNLKNLATAIEMYANDSRGRYPRKLELLTPDYIKFLPKCPGGERVTYGFDVTKEPDRFTVTCTGENHKGFCGSDFPIFSSKNGLKTD